MLECLPSGEGGKTTDSCPGGYNQNDGTARSIKTNESITSHRSEWPSSKNLQTINAGEGVEKREPSCTVGGNVN